MYTVEEFANAVRRKTGAYHDVDDRKLVDAYVNKHPVYKDQIQFDDPAQGPEPFLSPIVPKGPIPPQMGPHQDLSRPENAILV